MCATANGDFAANTTANKQTVTNSINFYLSWAPKGGFNGLYVYLPLYS